MEVTNKLPSIQPITTAKSFSSGGYNKDKTPLEDAWYTLTCIEFTPKEKEGKHGFNFTFEINAGKNKGRRAWLTVYPYTYQRQQMTLQELVKSVGFTSEEIVKIMNQPELLVALKGLNLMGKTTKRGEFVNIDAFAPDPSKPNGENLLSKFDSAVETVATLVAPSSAKLM